MDEAKRQQKLDFMIQAGYIATVILVVYVACKYAVSMLLPFVLAYGIALVLKPAVNVLRRDLKLPRSLATLMMMILFYGILSLLIALISVKLVAAGKDVVLRLPGFYTDYIAPAIEAFFDWIEGLILRFDPDKTLQLDGIAAEIISTLGTLITSLSSSILNFVARSAASVPSLLIRVLFTVIASFYFTMDYALITGFVLRQLGERTQLILRDAQRGLGKTLGNYIRSYGLIMLITFVELWIGLSIVGIEDAFFVALLIALFDILPVVGCGTVLVPWIIVSFAQGLMPRALGLAILWGIITVVRNVIEPRIVGDRVGLHPLATLMSMFVGGYVLGGVGIWLVPISLAIMSDMHRRGIIDLYREEEGAGRPANSKKGKGNEGK